MNAPKVLGMASSAGALVYIFIFMFFNPYTGYPVAPETIFILFFLFIAPSVLAFRSSQKASHLPLMVSGVWCLPITIYFSFSPGLFKWLFIAPLLFLLSAALMMIFITSEEGTEK
ncbi:hypothetical protein AB1K84_12665 [Mesobacillus foraminis]|uniref:hypothetical protein n=1 Tax=Mesobacillus foraminis TaxID=279826 RepID=UPI0039A2E939